MAKNCRKCWHVRHELKLPMACPCIWMDRFISQCWAGMVALADDAEFHSRVEEIEGLYK